MGLDPRHDIGPTPGVARTGPAVSRPVTLVKAPDAAAVAIVASTVNALPVPVDGPVAGRMASHLERWGMTVTHLDWPAPSGPAGALSDRVIRPGLVAAGAGVAPEVTRLAGALCGSEPIAVSSVPSQVASSDRSALILQHPAYTNAPELVNALRSLAEAGRSFGIIQVLDEDDGRLAVLKALAVSGVAATGRFTMMSSMLAMDDNAPPFVDDAGPTDASWLRSARDAVIVSGHSTPLDAAMGTQSALCSRAAVLADPALSMSAGQYPCGTDGRCFRQPLMGREAQSMTGLIDPADITAAVLVLSGCNSATLLPGYADPLASLGYRSQQGTAWVTVASACMSREEPELDLLLLSHLLHGMPIGLAVRDVNEIRRARGHADWIGAAGGPFVIFGNPEFRLTGTAQSETQVVEPADEAQSNGRRRHRIELGQLSDDASFLRVRISGDAPYLFLRQRPEGTWCRGVVEDAGDRLLHLQVRTPGGTLEIAEVDDDPFESVRAALRSAAATVPLWTVLLASYQRRARSAPIADRAQERLADVAQLDRLASALRVERGAIADELELRSLAKEGWRVVKELSSHLLEALAEACLASGTLHQMHWSDLSVCGDAVEANVQCACPAQAALWGQRHDVAGVSRVEYQCPCGPAGEDGGDGRLRLTDFPREVVAGDDLTMTARVETNERVLHVRSMPMIECHYRERSMIGSTSAITIGPAGASDVALSVPVPRDLVPGVYPAAVLAVANLTPAVLRRVVRVGASATTDS
jgi:hypothetical protein